MSHGKEPTHKTSFIRIYKKNETKTKGKFAIFFFLTS